MPIDAWTTLADPRAASPPLDMSIEPTAAELITVYGRAHRARTGQRGELQARAPVYEAGQSLSAQRLYASGPEWSRPEHKRLMSDAKDALGLCGAVFGLLTCENLSP